MDSRGPDRRQKSLDPLLLADVDRDVVLSKCRASRLAPKTLRESGLA
jgi:hypothetical protein